jgi:hypothetical protein
MGDTQNPYKSPESAGASGRPGSEAKRQRSRFWIVSTHLATTAFAAPLAAGLIANLAVSQGNLHGNQALLVTLCFQALGYIAGTYYSLSYLRKATAMRDPQGCTKASIVTFVILALVGLVSNVAVSKHIIPLQVAAWIVFYALICWAFARITRRGFAAMAADSAEQ